MGTIICSSLTSSICFSVSTGISDTGSTVETSSVPCQHQ